MISEFMFIILGYFMGSIPVGLILGWIKGIDIRKHGSGNIGAANAFRILGKKLGITTMVLDMVKGAIAVLAARIYLCFGNYDGFGTSFSDWYYLDHGFLLACVAIMAVLGHSFPVWLKFKGGKSASVAAGVIFGINPIAFVILYGVWILALVKTRYTSLSNLISALTAPPLYWFFAGEKFFHNQSWWAAIVGVILVLFVTWRHKENIKRLFAGTERKLGQKEKIEEKSEDTKEVIATE